ncbi:ATP-binding protein [Methylocapsa palsarum]|uniref:Uncharacterized protein YhaN n=1 Tax=Methylocapsa palsarum TaxID=1612308 RepID=A0A1I4B559_9HYPH|nr:AAA family ATPase [Methylocapsa palsarum]SFK63864.1 Uncharacterized protein YhaN [Methylocapsa palsarum]
MRLNRLDLIRYGKFTDKRIDFGAQSPGAPDLHIVYGPNEAGKSTALAAFLDLLFGIETRSRFNFLHPYAAMRIGGALEVAGEPRELLRLKRPHNSLLDASEQPIPEGFILGELGGLDRESYRAMFSLDDETLEAGGEGILASKGDLGQLLFSASAGLADLSRSLGELRTEADGFYKYRARSGELLDLKARLAALKDERDRIDTLASAYGQLVETRDRLAAQYEKAIGERGATQSRLDEIQRLLGALPRLTDLRILREQIDPLAGLPEAPLGWAEELPRLQKEEIELATRAQGVADEIAQLASDLESQPVDEAAANLADRIDMLADLRARHVTAAKDLPERRLQLREEDLTIAGILSRVDQKEEGDPARLVLGASIVGALRKLIETRSGVEAAAKAADNELSEARRRLDEAGSNLEAAGDRQDAGQGNAARMSSLAATVAALRADDHAARRRLAAQSRAAHLQTLAARIGELRPWQGDVEGLFAMAVPQPDTIECWKAAAAEAQKRIGVRGGEVERLTTERLRVKAEEEAIDGVVAVVSDAETAKSRAAREQAWASHRRTLDAASADAFEGALRQDDIVTSARLGHAGDLAKLQQTTLALAALEADLSRARQLLAAAETSFRTVHDEIEEFVRAMTPALADATLSWLEGWLTRRAKALETREFLLAAERDLAEADADAQAARDRLTAALGAAGVVYEADASFETLLATAQAAIDHETEVRSLRDAVKDRQRDLNNRVSDAEKAAAADQAWAALWAKACSECWLGEAGAAPSLETVREILAAIAELGPALEKKASLADRIAKMEKDQADFAVEVTAIARELGVPSSDAILDVSRAINDRAQAAKASRAKRDLTQQKFETARDGQRALAEALTIQTTRTTEMTAYFGVNSLAEVGAKLQGVLKKADLAKQAVAAERDILNALRSPTLEEAERALDAADRAALDAEVAELKARFDDQDRRSRDLFSEHSKAADRIEAVGGDDAVARLEGRRRTTLLEIEEKAVRYLTIRAGCAAAEQALRAYRDRHRSSMMARASDAFRTMSRGAYTGLRAQLDKDNEILIALGADGGSKIASELSKGARFQLYLALRVAGYYEFARSRRPPPFIADDIMETFDDFRAEEAFRLFAEMAAVGQVIYLTHHRHLCEIAKQICPTAQVHRLG